MIALQLLLACTTLMSADGGAVKFTYDDVSGSCEDFNDTIKSRGLKDPTGNTHPGTLGWTLCQFKASLDDPKLPVSRSANANRTCLSVNLKALALETDIAVIVARWSQSHDDFGPACQKELSRIDSEIKAHESHHVGDCKAILAEEKAAWAKVPHMVQACGDSTRPEELLMKDLRSRTTDTLHEILNKMNHEMEYRSKETHEKIGYGTTGIQCRSCSSQ